MKVLPEGAEFFHAEEQTRWSQLSFFTTLRTG